MMRAEITESPTRTSVGPLHDLEEWVDHGQV